MSAFHVERPRIWNGPAPVDRLGRTAPVKDQHWYSIQNLGGNAADVWIYAEIGAWGITAEGFVSELAQLNVADISVHLNSPGGDVFDGIAIMNALRDHPAKVTVCVDALAASIASVIAQAGDHVIMGRNSMMMIHNASGFSMGEAADLRKMADLLDQTTANIADVYAQRAGGKSADWLALMADETWFGADEAVAAGLADEVAPLPAERSAHRQAASFDLSVFNKAPDKLPDVDSSAPNPQALPEGETPDDVLEPGPIAWDPAAFRASMAEAQPKPIPWNPSLFKAAVSLVTNDAPAPADVPHTPEPEPVPGFDPNTFAQAIREARR
jgi:ATP-dependent protease ClpP protease subunit